MGCNERKDSFMDWLRGPRRGSEKIQGSCIRKNVAGRKRRPHKAFRFTSKLPKFAKLALGNNKFVNKNLKNTTELNVRLFQKKHDKSTTTLGFRYVVTSHYVLLRRITGQLRRITGHGRFRGPRRGSRRSRVRAYEKLWRGESEGPIKPLDLPQNYQIFRN